MLQSCIFEAASLEKTEFNYIKASISGSQTKIWLPFGAFEENSDGYLDILKWRMDGNTKGTKIPFPKNIYIDFKGTFISSDGKEIVLKDIRCRSQEIHSKGYT